MIRALLTTIALLAVLSGGGLVAGCGSSKSGELKQAEGGPLTKDEQPRFDEERADSGAH